MKNPRTLLIVVPRLVSYVGFLRELCGALMAGGVEVHVACSPAPLGDEEVASAADRVQLHHIELPRGMHPAAHLPAARALNRFVEMPRPDIVHAHFSAAIFSTALARGPAAALADRDRFIAEQTRIYENLFRPARTGPLTAVVAC
jgi:hypothetical protein